jgi:hypothetical protein
MVAYPQGVSQTLDIRGILFGAWGAAGDRTAARGEYKIVVRVIAPARFYPTGLEVHICDLILKELYSQGLEDASEGMGHVADLRVTGDDLRHHRPEGGVVQAIYQSDSHTFGPAERVRQRPRHREGSESTADYEALV